MNLSAKSEYALAAYIIFFLAINITGSSFFTDIGWAPYVNTASNTGAPSGATWIEGSNLKWADGSTEFTLTGINTVDSSSPGADGSLWIEGNSLHFVNANGDEKSFSGPPKQMTYYWYDTQTWYNNNDHPETTGELYEFFDGSNSGVSFGGSGDYNDRIYWHDSDWDAKPSYLPADDYSWKAEGYIWAPSSGTYDFAVDSDDASDVTIDGEVVASWYGGHGKEDGWSHSGSISLDQGWHRFKARMEEGYGGDGIGVAWQKPGDSSWSVIPSSRFADGTSSGTPGSMWLENRYIHYIDESGNERVLSSDVRP